jgi:hypothetical protein
MLGRVVAAAVGFVVLMAIGIANWDLDSQGPGGAPG